MAYRFEFRVEVSARQDMRIFLADSFEIEGDWLIFRRLPPEGGPGREYWRVNKSLVIGMETRRL